MGDYFDQAGQGIDQGKAALLQAIATQGSQAHAAIQAGQDQIAAAKQAAIQQALQGAQQRGAQQPELDQLTRTVSQPYDAQLAGLASSQASRDAGFAQQGSAAGTYMDEARAGLPALRTQLAQKVASMQAAAQAQASTFAQNQQLKNIELQIAQANLAKSQQANTSPDIGSIISKLGGADLAGGLLSGALQQGNAAADRSISQAQGGNMDVESITQGLGDKAALPDTIGQQIGLPGAAVSQLADLYQQKQQSSADNAGRTAANNQYTDEQRAEKQRQDALGALSVDPKNYGGVTAKAKDTDSSYGLKKGETVNVYAFAKDGYSQLMKQGTTIDDANAEVQRTLERFFGHDYPQLRSYLSSVYGQYAKG